MIVFKTIEEMQAYTKEQKQNGFKVGFVPTMGFLHEGHVSLMHRAKQECDIVVTSIFVNPTQFGPNEDFERYPRDFERDKEIAKNNGSDVLFYPSSSVIYPNEAGTKLMVTKRTNRLCGEKRPGHFDGVVTVLTKLFHIIQPDRAYFGQKDAQQVAIVDDLINSYFFPIQLVICPTIREEDGLAKSSRNVNLRDDERRIAPQLYEGLRGAKEKAQKGETVNEVLQWLYKILQRLEYGEVDYVEILSYPELQPVEGFDQKTIIALAYQFEGARLIDNIIMEGVR
ncbi:pantoate--beta-alanine ligase [Pseudalkalibacillus salsuginis]|uniref:pantoate--beta-alanine ligase n=1 Tax=Pseudalkalibacillus salsuginis TaxID=2910972 RepID=UPI001F26DD6A|nr:pantoate--beta-alanine ligase [Pseudalkalibacillus salsuginis]MCF6408207.1 pantoate--beta-alanine ligase [Pseudalkalibacillus salsuginis]